MLVLCTEPVAPIEPPLAFLSRSFAPDELLATVARLLTAGDRATADAG